MPPPDEQQTTLNYAPASIRTPRRAEPVWWEVLVLAAIVLGVATTLFMSLNALLRQLSF